MTLALQYTQIRPNKCCDKQTNEKSKHNQNPIKTQSKLNQNSIKTQSEKVPQTRKPSNS